MIYKHRLIALFIGLVILFLDILTKGLVQQHLPLVSSQSGVYPYGGIGMFKDFFGIQFAIVHNINQGAAWGIFSQWQNYLVALRIILIAAFIVYFLKNKHPHWDIPIACILAGAIGNVIDYFIYGHVIDMLHFSFWGYVYPTFNIADASICLGVIYLIFLTWKEGRIAAQRH